MEDIFAIKIEAAEHANKDDLYHYFGWTFRMDEYSIIDFIVEREPFVQFILERTCDLLIKSQKLEKINNDAIINLGGIARLACKEYESNEIEKNAINISIKLLPT